MMALCDEIEASAGDADVYNLIGVRTKIEATSFPYRHPQLCVYLQVTGHAGTASGLLGIMHARTDEEILTQPFGPIQLIDPLTFVIATVSIEDCEFPEPGLYYVQVSFSGKLLCERALHLLETSGNTNGQGSS